MLFTGDLPQVMMSLPGRGGTLSFGVISPRASKWLHEFDNIISTYEPGIMHYIIRDSELPEMQIELDVVTSVESDAMIVRITIGSLTYPLDLVWTFGGAAPIHGAPATGNPDPNGYVDELDMLFHPGHCSGNNVELSSDAFLLRAQTTGDRPIYGGCSYQGEFSIHNPKTFTLGPKFFMSSKAMLGQPLLAHKARIEAGNFEGYIVIDRPLKDNSPLSSSEGAHLFAVACKRRREIVSQITVRTPDDHLNLAVKSMCIAMDALWDAPTFMPGFPSDWPEALIHTPDISYDYQRNGDTEVIVISTPSSVAKIVKLIAKKDVIKEVRLDGNVVQPFLEPGIGASYIVLRVPASTKTEVSVTYSAAAETPLSVSGRGRGRGKLNFSPINYRSLEVAYVSDVDSFCAPGPGPHLVRLGNVHAQLLDIVLEDKIAKELKFECIANEVVVGLLGVTILM
jgi:hypothetical protein